MRRGGLKQRLAFAVVATGLVLVALEVTARALFQEELAAAAAPPPQPQDGAPTMRGNPYLLWEQAPGVRFEHGVPTTINSMGLRGQEPVIPKPDGVRRLLATGDSSVYGFGVGDTETFIQVAAADLGVEGWNAAIPGYSTFQTLNMLEMRAWALEPDVLVIANMWSDNNFDSFVDRDLLNAYSSFEGSRAATVQELLSPLAFYRLLHYRLRVAASDQAEARKVGWQLGSGGQVGARRVEVNDYAANLDRLAQMALSEGREVVFILLANREDLFDSREAGAAWSIYREVMQDAAARHGAPIVDVPTAFRESGLSGDELFIDEMHPTTKGHAIIGAELAVVLKPWADGGTVLKPGTHSAIPSYVDEFVMATAEKESDGQVVIELRVVMPHYEGKMLQVDAIDLSTGSDKRIGGAPNRGPGKFRFPLDAPTEKLGLVLYEDITGDGPSGDDKRYVFDQQPIYAMSDLNGIIVDVDRNLIFKE